MAGFEDTPQYNRLSDADKGLWAKFSNQGKGLVGKAVGGVKAAAVASTKVATKSINSLGDALKELKNPTEEVLQGFTALVASSAQFQKQNQKFFQAGYTSSMFDFRDSIAAANKASLDLNGNLTAGANVATAFRDKTLAIAVSSREFRETLMETGVVLQGAGFDMQDFASIVDSAAFAFNKNESEIKALTSTLINVQREIPVSGKTLATNFQFAQKSFAYSSEKMMDNFIGLQKMSTTTGVSFEGLTSAFGSSMDSFEKSAAKAGRLNQILGKSTFNSMEMLTMTETERATKIRSAIMSSGRSIEEMGKFELMALKDTIGLGSIEDTRKFLRGDLKIDEKKAMKAIEAKDPTKLKSKQLGETLDGLRKGINRTRPVADRFAIALSNVSRAAVLGIVESKALAVKFKALGVRTDQLLPAFLSESLGGSAQIPAAGGSTTGLQQNKQFESIQKVLDVIDKQLPAELKTWGVLAASTTLASSDAAKALLIASKSIEKLVSPEVMENFLNKIKGMLKSGGAGKTPSFQGLLEMFVGS
jgi:hypothetical protein